jgi:hypothetical protein
MEQHQNGVREEHHGWLGTVFRREIIACRRLSSHSPAAFAYVVVCGAASIHTVKDVNHGNLPIVPSSEAGNSQLPARLRRRRRWVLGIPPPPGNARFEVARHVHGIPVN